jgi:hypothetical protein
MISAFSGKGLVVRGFVGPKIASVLVPKAAAICAGPVSFEITKSHTLKNAVASAKSVLPVKIKGLMFDFAATSFETSSSSFEPIRTTPAFNSD